MLDAWERDTGAHDPKSRSILYALLLIAFGAVTLVLVTGIWSTDRYVVYVLMPAATAVAGYRLVKNVRARRAELAGSGRDAGSRGRSLPA